MHCCPTPTFAGRGKGKKNSPPQAAKLLQLRERGKACTGAGGHDDQHGRGLGVAVWRNTPFGKVRAVRALRIVIDAAEAGGEKQGLFVNMDFWEMR